MNFRFPNPLIGFRREKQQLIDLDQISSELKTKIENCSKFIDFERLWSKQVFNSFFIQISKKKPKKPSTSFGPFSALSISFLIRSSRLARTRPALRTKQKNENLKQFDSDSWNFNIQIWKRGKCDNNCNFHSCLYIFNGKNTIQIQDMCDELFNPLFTCLILQLTACLLRWSNVEGLCPANGSDRSSAGLQCSNTGAGQRVTA